ncbi:MAG: hypothetical protein KR126chlam5_01194 [Candidatus Anoxychlamydiales bacterium]|nr:hypothetical protein [Candidatus Anoxychlamydiales bacterium]
MTLNPLFLLENMPEEILVYILKQDLDIVDLKAVRLLGRKWYKIATDDDVWRNIAEKINFTIRPQITKEKIFNLVHVHVGLNLNKARLHKLHCFEDSYLRNWVNKNIKNDSDIIIEKIKKLYREIEKELRWKPFSFEVKAMDSYRSRRAVVFCNRSAAQTLLM